MSGLDWQHLDGTATRIGPMALEIARKLRVNSIYRS
jgi:hypothetical protein